MPGHRCETPTTGRTTLAAVNEADDSNQPILPHRRLEGNWSTTHQSDSALRPCHDVRHKLAMDILQRNIPATTLSFDYVRTQSNTWVADIDVIWPLRKWPHISVRLAAKGARNIRWSPLLVVWGFFAHRTLRSRPTSGTAVTARAEGKRLICIAAANEAATGNDPPPVAPPAKVTPVCGRAVLVTQTRFRP